MSSWNLLQEIYCRFSLAMSYAQGIERSLLTLLMMRERGDSEMPLVEFLALESIWSRRTLGFLIREVHGKMGRSSRVSDLLEQSLDIRNYLAHHFFRDRAEHLADPDMHQGVLRELQRSSELLEKTGNELDAIIKDAMVTAGLTEEEYEDEIRQMMTGLLSKARAVDDETPARRSSYRGKEVE